MAKFYRHAFTGMTGEAEFSALFGKQDRILRGMGLMTGVALPLLKGRMLEIATSLEIRYLVAVVAELATL